MKPASFKRWTIAVIAVLALATPGLAATHEGIGRIVVFGTSLSDPGNAYALYGGTNNPPYDTLDDFLVPSCDDPYTRGGHHLSNGSTWIEQFAGSRGLAMCVGAAFRSANDGATNYAVCGARAYEDGINTNLSVQVSEFLHDFDNVAPPDALFVLEFGNNDVRDALLAAFSGGDSAAIMNAALTSIGDNMGVLYMAGARQFLVLNVPDFRLVPAIGIMDSVYPGAEAFAEFLSHTFNVYLNGVLDSVAGLPGVEIHRIDVFEKLIQIDADPGAYGLSVVDRACITPNVPPFECQNPDEYMFWDGIHPTRAGHNLLAHEAAMALGLE